MPRILIYPCVHVLPFISTKLYCIDRVHNLELTLNKIRESGIKFNIEKSFLGQNKMEYLGTCVTVDGVKPIDKKYKQ